MRHRRSRLILTTFLLCLTLVIPCSGKDFGIQGELLVLEEENLLHLLQRQLSSRLSSETLQALIQQALVKGQQPPPGRALSSATYDRTFYYDPTYILPTAITDSQGALLIASGTKINPLETLRLSSGLLFLDGNDPSHLQWARKEPGIFKWILVQGNPFELEKDEQRPVYFDQQGFSISKFQIQFLPARVTQEGSRLKIEEMALNSPQEAP